MTALIEKAANFAKEKHQNQVRKFTGLSYFDNHIEPVVSYIKKYSDCIPEEAICAGYLHDVSEDCGITITEIETEFNKVIASLVDEVTNKFSQNKTINRKARKKLEHARLSKISSLGKYIKLCDRIHNLESMFMEDESAQKQGESFYYYVESVDLLNNLCEDGTVETLYPAAVCRYQFELCKYKSQGG